MSNNNISSEIELGQKCMFIKIENYSLNYEYKFT